LTRAIAAASPDRGSRRRCPSRSSKSGNELSSHLGYINDKLEGRNYLLGDELTAADIQLSFFGELASARTGIASYPNIGAWVNRFQARPPYKAALERGGAHSFA